MHEGGAKEAAVHHSGPAHHQVWRRPPPQVPAEHAHPSCIPLRSELSLPGLSGRHQSTYFHFFFCSSFMQHGILQWNHREKFRESFFSPDRLHIMIRRGIPLPSDLSYSTADPIQDGRFRGPAALDGEAGRPCPPHVPVRGPLGLRQR